ncbi:putative membrane protein [Roseiarcus fermentans]|uniref:Putative membrane protein n=1 Tax=Roseiarcus fermentans TaxID=1473586 RepID=A0A366FHI0_9HYPH|nr:DUF2189 domain-containing protein [Roseiarcus fermentans]RBP14118.1 putative membrane protein [Roseiarcus fermentans]
MTSTFHVYFGPHADDAPIEVRKLGTRDAFAALREGVEDFFATPTHPVFVGVFYALAGIALAALSSFGSALQLVFPLAAGFALLGPFFAVGLYELSRRREAGLAPSWLDAFAVFRSPALPSVFALGGFLLALFALWLATAEYLYVALYGPDAPSAAGLFVRDVFTTSRGWTMIAVGCLVGFGFAAVALAISVVSFPLMIDRDVGLAPAIVASVRLARENPAPVAVWGAIVAAALAVGSAPLFIGLAVVMPILGHATWRFYRRAIVRDPAHEVPIEDPTGEALVESPGLKQLWTFLDVLETFRKRR